MNSKRQLSYYITCIILADAAYRIHAHSINVVARIPPLSNPALLTTERNENEDENKNQNENSCNFQQFICDPDKLLLFPNDLLHESFEEELQDILGDLSVADCSSVQINNVKDKSEFNGVRVDENRIEYGVAIVRKMDLDVISKEIKSYNDEDELIDKAAEVFARSTHDAWGVGSTTCNSGVLLFLAIEDRAVYISIGEGLEKVLPSWRLSKIISHMKPFLREVRIAGAITNAFMDIRDFVKKGPPSWSEIFLNQWLPDIVIFLFVLFLIWYIFVYQAKMQSEYNYVRRTLTELERNRAEALQGNYECSSCPICLQNFQRKGVDGRWNIGSDGLPLVLLRCGHVFDETCYNEYEKRSTHSQIRCPICRDECETIRGIAPIDHVQEASSEEIFAPDTGSDQSRDENDWTSRATQYENYWMIRERRRSLSHGRHAVNLQRRELEFRLNQLRIRYPRYVTANQVQRWSNASYRGSFPNDESFRNLNPSKYESDSSTRSTRPISFGGGKSFSGRGGRW